MTTVYFLQRNIKWRFHNAFTIVVTILQPLLWLFLYGTIASGSMQTTGITNYTAFILPGLVVLVTFSACGSSGIMNYLMKNDGSFYKMLIAPVSRRSIIAGQIMEGVLCSLLETGIMFITSLFFRVRIHSGITGCICIMLIISLTAFFMAGLAYGISLSLPNEIIYETVMNAIVLPIFFMSTALFPAESMSGFAAKIIYVNPFTHIINELRSLVLTTDCASIHLLKVVLMLLVMCTVTFCWAGHRLNKQTDL